MYDEQPQFPELRIDGTGLPEDLEELIDWNHSPVTSLSAFNRGYEEIAQPTNTVTWVLKKKKSIDDVIMKEVDRYHKSLLRKEGLSFLVKKSSFVNPDLEKYAQTIEEHFFKEDNNTKLAPSQIYALFVTLSPEPDSCTPEQLLATAQAICKPKSGMLECYFSIEQSGTEASNNIGYHPHLHILIVRNTQNQSGEPGKLKAMVTRHCKRYKTKSEAYLQIKFISQRNYKSKLDYIMGLKYDESKHAQVRADQIWRMTHSLQTFYTSSPLAGVNK